MKLKDKRTPARGKEKKKMKELHLVIASEDTKTVLRGLFGTCASLFGDGHHSWDADGVSVQEYTPEDSLDVLCKYLDGDESLADDISARYQQDLYPYDGSDELSAVINIGNGRIILKPVSDVTVDISRDGPLTDITVDFGRDSKFLALEMFLEMLMAAYKAAPYNTLIHRELATYWQSRLEA